VLYLVVTVVATLIAGVGGLQGCHV
jgi:hypothetical protein